MAFASACLWIGAQFMFEYRCVRHGSEHAGR
jgi:hypothetical protein